MSRVGKKPIEITEGVKVKIADSLVTVTGPKGTLEQKLHPLVEVKQEGSQIIVLPKKQDDQRSNAFWGLYRSLLQNMVTGVSEGFERKLEMKGVGYKCELKGDKLILNVGYSHPVEFSVPQGIKIDVQKGTIINIFGIEKQQVGETAANIRKIKKPEPYKGKGIRYFDEVVKIKEGKTAAKAE